MDAVIVAVDCHRATLDGHIAQGGIAVFQGRILIGVDGIVIGFDADGAAGNRNCICRLDALGGVVTLVAVALTKTAGAAAGAAGATGATGATKATFLNFRGVVGPLITESIVRTGQREGIAARVGGQIIGLHQIRRFLALLVSRFVNKELLLGVVCHFGIGIIVIVGGAAGNRRVVLGIDPHIVRFGVIVLDGVIILIVGKADEISIRRRRGHLLGVIGVLIGVNIHHRGFPLDHHIIGRIQAVTSGVDGMAAAGDGDSAPLVALGRNVRIGGFDAIAHGCNNGGVSIGDLHAVVTLEAIIHASHQQGEIFHLQIILGVNAVVMIGGHRQFALAGNFQIHFCVDRPGEFHFFSRRPPVVNVIFRILFGLEGHFVTADNGDGIGILADQRKTLELQLKFVIHAHIDDDVALPLAGDGVCRFLIHPSKGQCAAL